MSNAQFETVSAIKRTDIPKLQTAQTIKISTKEAVKKILSCGIDSSVNSYECMSGEAAFFGRTNIKLLYIDETDVLCSANYNADFTDRILGGEIGPTAQLDFGVNVVDYRTEINHNLVTIQLILEVSAAAFVPNTVTCLGGGAGLFARTAEYDVVTDAHSSSFTADISEELTASGNINRVLLAESNVTPTDYNIDGDVLTISGDSVITLVYASGNEVRSDKLPFKFALEADAKGLPSSSQLSIRLSPKNTRVKLDILEDEVNSTFTADVTLGVTVFATATESISVVEDAYTTDSDLDFTKTLLYTTLPCGSVTAKRFVEQTVPFGHHGEYVCTTDARVVVTKCASLEQRCLVEGIISGNVIYRGDEGFESTRVELPFSEAIDIDYIMPSCVSYAEASVSDISVHLASNINVAANVVFFIDSSKAMAIPCISDVNETPLEVNDSSAIEICLAKKGETLWQLAKGLHISEEDILTINPDIKSPLEQDTKIVIYNAL
jgi:hypothetical protein